MEAVFDVDELGRDAQPVACLTDTSFKNGLE